MVMETLQIRLTKRLVEELDKLVKEGFYSNKSEAVRDAVRRLVLEHELGELGEALGEEGDEGTGGESLLGALKKIKGIRDYCY